MKNVKTLTATILIGMGLLVGGCGNNQTTDTNKPVVTQEQQQKKPIDIAYEKFIDIKMRSSYDQVKQLLGVDGVPTASNTIGNLTTEGYNFKVNGIVINVQFQNGELSSKQFHGGYYTSENVTLEQYNKIQQGMTYEQVKEVFDCEGVCTSKQQYSNGDAYIHMTWRNKAGGFAMITFNGNAVVTGKSQGGLH